MGFFEETMGFMGKSLAKSATSYLSETTGYDVGGTLAYLFGNDQTTKGETLDDLTTNIAKEFKGHPDGLALLQNSLNEQSAEIGRIGNQLTAMASAIQEIYGEIKGIQDLLAKINQQALYASWQAQDNNIKVFRLKIDSAFQLYGECISTKGTSVDEVKQLTASILDPNDGEVNAGMEINGFMLSDQQSKGALQLWAEMTCPLIEQGLLDYRQAVDQYQAYYTKLTWAQLRATNLVMEAHHFSKDSPLAQQAWQDYKQLLVSQENEFIGNLVSIVRSGLVGSIARSYGLTAYQAAAQFHPDLTEIRDAAETYLGTYYEPSSVLMGGEALLAQLSLTDPADRRMVVHMTFFGDAFKTAIDSAKVTLDLIDSAQGASSLTPTRAPTVYGPLVSPVIPSSGDPDSAWATDTTFYFKRMLYEGSASTPLVDGYYQLTNLNGLAALQPMSTYFGMVPFQTDAVLGYAMQVNATQAFDYMNFAGYFANHYANASAKSGERVTLPLETHVAH